MEWGLITDDDAEGYSCDTPLGRELQVDILMVFLGAYDEMDVLPILGDLITDEEENEMLEREHNAELVTAPIIRAAYRRRFNTSFQPGVTSAYRH